MAQLKKQKTGRDIQVNLWFAALACVVSNTVQAVCASAKTGGDLYRFLLQGQKNADAESSGKSLEANQLTDDDFRKNCGALAKYVESTFRIIDSDMIPEGIESFEYNGAHYVQLDLGKNDVPKLTDKSVFIGGEEIPIESVKLAELPELPGIPVGERKAKERIQPVKMDLAALLAKAGVK